MLQLIFRSGALLYLFSLLACSRPKQTVDLIITGATIYTMDKDSSVFTSMAIHNGRIVGIGSTSEIRRKFKSENEEDYTNKFIYPGLIDAHSHFYGLSQSMVTVDLRGAKSEDEMIQRVVRFNSPENVANGSSATSIMGRGWDQNLWETKEFPNNQKLNELYPHIPVCLTRIDGHAALVNQKALELAGINEQTRISGGDLIKKEGKLTGVLIDNAVDLVTSRLPKPSNDEIKEALKMAETECLKFGLTTVSDAGIDKHLIDIYHEMHQSGELRIRIYAMANPTNPTLSWLIRNGIFKSERLHVRSVKYYMDGAMGSRGACLLEDYSDQPGNRGFLLNNADSLLALARMIKSKGLQMNVHCIGDSANRITLNTMAAVLDGDSTSRWRIEHMQLIHENDLGTVRKYKIIPSMQPTHATSDAAWVDERLGFSRLKMAYALATCMRASGKIALGTDFPVEEINPFYTYFAAIYRKHPVSGESFDWLQGEGLTPYETLQGMTIWAAYAQFEEHEKGSLEVGKFADFIVMNEDLMNGRFEKMERIMPIKVFLNGKLVAGKDNS